MKRQDKNCQVKDCETKHYAKSLCKKHYTQVLRHGRLTPERERGIERICGVESCERTDTVGRFCRKHARQIRTHGRLTPEREHQMGNSGCKEPGCSSPHRAKGYCVKHYNQARWQRIKRQLERIKELEARAEFL
ncbi:MAG: hypothetical protein ACYTFT_15065 [Planctomycetota bacterium]|jgi:hypothetical protein